MEAISAACIADVIDVLGPERDELLTLLAGLDDHQWELPTECPAWTVRASPRTSSATI